MHKVLNALKKTKCVTVTDITVCTKNLCPSRV